MRKILVLAAALPLLAGCFHTTVAPLSDGQKRVTFYDDSPPPLGRTSPIVAENLALWSAGRACPTGFKVTDQSLDLGSFPRNYSIVVQCRPAVVAVKQ